MQSRRLTFAVGTSLLTASLLSVGCKPPHVNTRPEVPEEPHVNEGPTESPEEPDAEEPESPEAPDDGMAGKTAGPEGVIYDEDEEEGPPPEDQPNVNVHPSKAGK